MIKILVGKSASGKDTMLKKLVSAGAKPIVSYTTRPKREGETDGVDYHFVSNDEFWELVKAGQMVEYRSYETCVGGVSDTWFYGTPTADPSENLVVIQDINGALKTIGYYGAEDVEVICLECPKDIRKERAKLRGSFDESEWRRRADADDRDFSENRIRELSKALGRPVPVVNTSGAGEKSFIL